MIDMEIPNNKTILDLSKVQHGTFFYRSQQGDMRRTKPKMPTVNGSFFDIKAKVMRASTCLPDETMLQMAVRKHMLDVWTPVVTFTLTANHNIEYYGDKAVTMWKAWNERIFNKKKGK